MKGSEIGGQGLLRPGRVAAMTTPPDGLAGGDETVEVPDDELEAVAQAAFGAARAGGGVSEMAEALLPELRLLVARVRAEAVAGERQRIAELVTAALVPDDVDEWSDNNEGWNRALGRVLRDLRAAAGSVPVVTPLDDDMDRLRSIWRESPHTRSYVEDRYPGLAHSIERAVMHAEPVATPAEPGESWMEKAARRERGWSARLSEAAAAPSVGTGTPAEAGGFEPVILGPGTVVRRRSPAEEVSGGSGHTERQEPATWQLDTTSLDADVRTERDEWRELAERARAENESLTAEVVRYLAAIERVFAAAEVAHRGRGESNPDRLREIAERVSHGDSVGGQHSRTAVAGLLTVVADLAAALGDGK